MTTFDEISTDRDANRIFWTVRAKIYYHCYITHKDCLPITAALERQAFREAMADRRNLTYFKGKNDHEQHSSDL